jgi:hypothetical protein
MRIAFIGRGSLNDPAERRWRTKVVSEEKINRGTDILSVSLFSDSTEVFGDRHAACPAVEPSSWSSKGAEAMEMNFGSRVSDFGSGEAGDSARGDASTLRSGAMLLRRPGAPPFLPFMSLATRHASPITPLDGLAIDASRFGISRRCLRNGTRRRRRP